MKKGRRQSRMKMSDRVYAVLLSLCLVVVVGVVFVRADEGNNVRKLQNGSFEEGQTFTGSYLQTNQSNVPSWNTTATDGRIELFRKNKGTYFNNVTLEPSAGTYAAELNADEESTLYQIVKTTPSSVYEWGLDHGARNGADTMALIIGPNQSVKPSKTAKNGRDQFMQMVDWLIDQGMTSFKTSAGLGEQLTVYSKKFAASGTFADNAGNNAFSLTPSTIYTEEWHIWIMSSCSASSGTNPWNSYGSNAEGSAGSESGSGSTEVDLSKYYLYTVPAGQTETLFGFVSVGYVNSPTTAEKAKTYGNFLDGINFQLYHPLSGSSTAHGSAVIGGSDGTTEGEGGSENGHKVTVDDKLTTYVTDGEALKVQAIVKKGDAENGCEFVGLYYTQQDGSTVKTEFLKIAGNVIDDTGSLTDEQKKGKWIKSTNENGDTVYTYYLENLTSPTDLHFVFIKNPTVTYDPNGGKAYKVDRTYNTEEAENVYSFKPAEEGTRFISPYISHAANGQNDGWKFMGWLLTGDTIDGVSRTDLVNANQLGSLLLPAVHTVACDYSTSGASEEKAAQYFKIYEGNLSLTEKITQNGETITGVEWTDGGAEKAYANVHKGLTMVAQWRWRQAFIPQVGSGNTYTNSDVGGTVEITSVTDESDANYNAAYNADGGKSYHAETDETITVKATAKTGCTFEGWYDASGKLVTTKEEFSYVEQKESVNTYYARFSNSVTQTYIRQVKNGDTWEDTTEDKIGTLGRYTYTDAVGTPISSTATAGTGYKFVGWYDSDGNKVGNSMLTNNGATLSYTTTGNATYYARFETAYTVKFAAQTKQSDGSFKTDNVGGKVSVASVSDVANGAAISKATANANYKFLGWYDKDGNQLSTNATYSTTTTSATNGVTYYARFEAVPYTVKFAVQTKQDDGTFKTDTRGGTVSVDSVTDVNGKTASSKATANANYKFLGWYDKDGNQLGTDEIYSTTTTSATNGVTYYARFEAAQYTVNFAAQTKQADGSFKTDNVGGKVSMTSVTDVANAAASSKATANANYKFLGWYDKDGKQLSTNSTYSTTTTSATNGATYYARFEIIPIVPTATVEGIYLSFIAESDTTQIPTVFNGRDAGTGINALGYGLDSKYGNTIATGFKYSVDNMTSVNTLQITVTVPDSAYVKVGGTGSFTGNGTSILTDSRSVAYNKGSIQQISGATTLTYYWDASGLQANTTYGFVIDNLYAPGATATITVNGTAGTKVTSSNGVVNTASGDYRANSHYTQ